jgi:hypothetical protein
LFITAALAVDTKGDEEVVPEAYGTVTACEVRQVMRNRQEIKARLEVGKTRTKIGIPGNWTRERK